MTLHESSEHISKLRKDASLSGEDDEDPNSLGGTSKVNNLFSKISDKKKDIKDGMQVFGDRGQGIYQDAVLKKIDAKVAERIYKLE